MNKKTIFSLIKDMVADHFFTLDELAGEFGYSLVPKKKKLQTVADSSQIQTENYEGDYYTFPVCFDDGKISRNQRDEAEPIGIVVNNLVFLRGYFVDKRFPEKAPKSHWYIALHHTEEVNTKRLYTKMIDIKIWKELWKSGDLEKMSEQLKQMRAQPFELSEKHWGKNKNQIVCWWIENGKFRFTDKNLPAEALFRPVIAVDKLKK